MDLTGRYIKVLDDSSIKHYPCTNGDYILFNNIKGRDIEEWGDFSKNHDKISPRYWGRNVHKDSRFQLMPIGFHPDNVESNYEIY